MSARKFTARECRQMVHALRLAKNALRAAQADLSVSLWIHWSCMAKFSNELPTCCEK